jgi:hypothetical protein
VYDVVVQGRVTTMLDAARSAYAAGLCVLPTKADGSKAPAVETWGQYVGTGTRPMREEMRSFRFETRVGLGMIAGPASGYRATWDFDTAEVFDAFVDAAIESGLGDVVTRIRAGYEDQTPGGGRRWILTLPATVEWRDCTFARRPGRDGEPPVKTLIEMPTFAILAPSNGATHPSGKPYVHVSGDFTTIASCTAEEHEALCELARSFDQMPRPQAHQPRERHPSTGTRPGDDYNRRTTWRELLTSRDWTPVYDRGDVSHWRRPGKTHGISATTNYGGADRLYVFTNSTIFDPEKSYNRFEAYAVLEHRGDFTEAARALARDGYGQPAVSGPTDRREDPPADKWPPPLRPAAYHGIFGDIVQALAPQTEADPAAILVQVLVMFGNVIGRTAHFRVGADVHYGNLFAAIVGETSKARKGVSRTQAERIFTAVDDAWVQHCSTSGLSSAEGLMWAIRDPIEKQQPIKERGRVIDYQVVIEDPGVADKRLLAIETELASTFKVMGREGNTLSPVIRQAWDGHNLRTLTKTLPVRVTAPLVSIIGHITAAELRRDLEVTETANGFGNRFLWVCARRSRELPDGGTAVDLHQHAERLRKAVVHAQHVGELRRDADAKRLWHRVYGPLSAGYPGMFGAMTARAEAQVMRLACLYAVGDRASLVTPAHLRAALEVWRYCRDSAAYLFSDRLGDATADKILQELRRVSPDGIRRSDITRDLFDRNKPASEITRALELLERHHLARHEDDRTGEGPRPIEWWYSVLQPDDINDINDITPEDDGAAGSNVVNVVAAVGTNVVNVVNVVVPSAPDETIPDPPDWEDIT